MASSPEISPPDAGVESPAQLTVGLTGGLASGKSTVARLLSEAGCTVIDADRVVAELYEPGASGNLAVRELFGQKILDERGAVDRAALAEIVFAEDGARRRLEEVIHPLVQEHSARKLAAARGIVVYEATLLVEAGRADDFDLVVTVETPTEIRLARAVQRGMDEGAARARLEAQGDGAQRRARADLEIENDGSPGQLAAKVEGLLQDLRRRLRPIPATAMPAPGYAIVLVTGNPNKLAEAQRILGRDLANEAIDLPEIQSLDLNEVLAAKGEEAWRRLGRPLIVEETGLELDALNGFPGPLIKWMLEAVGAEGIARTGLALGERGLAARCALLYRFGPRPEDAIVAEGITRGRLVLPRGDGGFGWDPIFLLEEEGKTFGELSPGEKDRLGHRGRAWRALLGELEAAEALPVNPGGLDRHGSSDSIP